MAETTWDADRQIGTGEVKRVDGDRREQIHALFQQEANHLYNYVVHMCPTGVDAQDVVQDVFVKAFRFWHTFHGQSSPRTWLFTIARNHLYDMKRKEQRENESLRQLEIHTPAVRGFESAADLYEIIGMLPRIQQEILFLRVIQGFSVEETAQILEMSSVSVRVSLHRARKRIAKQWFGPEGHERGVEHGNQFY